MNALNIRQTLRKKLFGEAVGLPGLKNLFQENRDLIFPGEIDFIAFLDEQNYEKLEDIAKRILLRLSYESTFPPPSRLIFNLLNLESSISGNEKDSQFIAKDHFVHLVNLYLLGIYVYFYHEAINNAIDTSFKKIFKKERPFDHNLSSVAFISFLKAWQFFVLNHDLGYPLEYLFGIESEQFEKMNGNEFLKPFSQIKKYLVKDVALKTITKLILFDQILDSAEDSFEIGVHNFLESNLKYYDPERDKLYNISKEKSDNILNLHKEKKHIAKVLGPSSLALLLSLIPLPNIVAVLRRKNEEEPLIIVVPVDAESVGAGAIQYQIAEENEESSNDKKNSNSKGIEPPDEVDENDNESTISDALSDNKSQLSYEVYFTENFRRNSKKIKISKLIKDAFAFNTYDNKYEWTYYTDYPKNSLVGELENVFKSITYNDFKELSNFLIKDASFSFSLISSDKMFGEFSYQLYYSLYHTLEMTGDDPANLSSYERANRITIPIIKKLEKNFPKDVAEIFRKNAFKYFKDNNVFIKNKQDIAEAIEKILLTIGKNTKEIAKSISNEINDNIKDQIELSKKVDNLWRGCREVIENAFLDEDVEDVKFIVGQNDIEKDLFTKLKHASAFSDFEKDLEKRNLTLGAFQNYKPSFAKDVPDIYDHGIASGLLAINNLRIYDAAVKKAKNVYNNSIKTASLPQSTPQNYSANQDINSFKLSLLKLGLTEGKIQTAEFLDFLRSKVMREAIFSIFIHNIYPKDFDPATYRTSLKNAPFAYFCLLCDSLQPWDRKRLLNQGSFKKLPYSTYGNRFNIEISNSIFNISEQGDNLNMQERMNSLRTYLNDYLENASQIIKLSLKEL